MYQNKIVVNGIFHDPFEGILLQKTKQRFLQLPGLRITKTNFSTKNADQIIEEITVLQNYFYNITGSFFWTQTGVSFFNFTSKNRQVRTYYLNLDDEEYFDDFNLPNSSFVYLPGDISKIRQNRHILSDDKTILIYYLENQKKIQNRFKRFLLDIKAIA